MSAEVASVLAANEQFYAAFEASSVFRRTPESWRLRVHSASPVLSGPDATQTQTETETP